MTWECRNLVFLLLHISSVLVILVCDSCLEIRAQRAEFRLHVIRTVLAYFSRLCAIINVPYCVPELLRTW